MVNRLTHPDTIDLMPFVAGLTMNQGKHCLLATAAKLSKLEMRVHQNRGTPRHQGES